MATGSRKDIAAIKARFKEIDKNNDGTLDASELGMLLRQGKPNVTNRDVRLLFESLDVDQSGRIDFDEFVDFIYATNVKGGKMKGISSTRALAQQVANLPTGVRHGLAGGGVNSTGHPTDALPANILTTDQPRGRGNEGQVRKGRARSPSPRPSNESKGPLSDALGVMFDALDHDSHGALSPDQIAEARRLLEPLSLGGPGHVARTKQAPRGRPLPASFARWAMEFLGALNCPSDEELARAVVEAAKSVPAPCAPWIGYADSDCDKLTEVLPAQLFLTSAKTAADRDMAANHDISHVVSLREEFMENMPKYFRPDIEQDNVRYCCIGLVDDEKHADVMEKNLAKAVEFVADAILCAHRVLVSCENGISASATVVIAYLVAHKGAPLRAAFEFTRKARPVVWPNPGFMQVLINWEATQRKGRTPTMRASQYALWSSQQQLSLEK